MKPVSLALSMLIVALVSCSKNGLLYKSDYDKSYRTWLDFKDSSGNSYRYMVARGSWSGYGTETIITVKEGKVTERSFTARMLVYSATGVRKDSLISQWTENAPQLSSHEHGAPPLTLDDIYKEARENWLHKRDDAQTYFEAHNNGKISTCGYVPGNCEDDCFRGIHIKFIEGL